MSCVSSTTLDPAPIPSVAMILVVPFARVILDPDPALMVSVWPPLVLFSMIQTLLVVFGPKVITLVVVKSSLEVIFKARERAASAAPSAMVIAVSALAMISVP